MIRISVSNDLERGITRIPKTQVRSMLEISKDAFDSMKMRFFRIGLVPGTHAAGKHDARATRSKIEQRSNL